MIVQPEVSSIVVKLPHPLAVQTVLSRLPSTSPPLTPLSPGLETSSTSTTNVTTAQQHPPKLNDLNCLNTHISNISVNNSQLTATTTTTTTTPTTTPPWLQTQNCNQLPLSISIESNSSSLPITSTPDSPLSLSQDIKECSTVAEDHFYCRRETTGSTLSHPAPESLIVLQSSGTSAGAEVSASTVSPEVDTEIKRFFLQRHPDGRLLLVPIVETIVATTTTEPVVVDNSPTPRSPLFRIALADSSSGQFPVVATTELNDPISSPSFVFTATLLSSTTSSGQIPISGSTALASPPISSTASAVRTGQDTPTLVATSSTAAVNNTTPQQASTSTELATASQTSTMTSYVFTSQQQLTSANNGSVSFEHHHQPQHELALPPVETIFSQQHPQQHIMQTRGSGGGATPLGFGDFDPLFSNMVDDQQSFRGPTTVFSDHHIDYYGQVDSTTTLIEDDDDDELLSASKCLPFGYYYDNQKIFNKLEMISSSLPSSTTSSSSPLLDALEINDLFSNSTTTNSGSLSQSQQQQQQQQQSQHHALSHPHHAQNVHQPQPQQQQLQPMHQHATQQQQNIKQEFAGEQFQAFTSSSMNHNTGSGYGMVGYGQDPLISGRTTVMHQKCSPTAPIQIKSEIKTEDEDEEILSMLDIGWMNNCTGQMQNGIGDVPHQSFGGPNQQHNTISSTSSPTIVNGGSEFWNGGQSALQSPTIATTSGQATGESPMFEDLLVPELDDSSLEIENILSQNPMFGSPPKLSNCLVKDQTQAQHFARPSFVRQQQQHPQQQRQTALGELLLRNSNNSDSMAPVLVQNQQASGVNKAMTVAITTNSGLQQQQQQPPTATIHHRPQHPTPMQQQNRSMQNYCPTLAALITRPTPNGGGGGADISHTQGLNSSSSSSVQPQHHQLRNLIAHQLTMHSSRNRNNSMSTDYSISSHDEGFASQQEDGSESDESAILSLQPEHDTLEGEMFYMDMGPTAHPMMSSMSSNGVLQTAPQQQAQQQHSSPSMQMMATPIQQQQPQQQQMQCDFMFQQPTTSYEDAEMHLGPSSTSDDDEEEEEDDDDDESFYGDYNAEDLLGATTSDDVNNKWSLNMGRSRKGSEKRYFWQYNVQSKGPKAPKYTTAGTSLEHEGDDPHIFREISDPVFAPDCQVEGVKHSGKARRGDGNDLTPNPKKLLMIGLELKKLSKIINDLTPVTDVPVVCRNDTRKEKNKLASRACRLKKKAQHEANKIKLHGLHREHNKLMRTIGEIKKIVQASVKVKDNQQRTPMLVQLSNNIQLQVGLTSDVNTLVNDTIARNKPILEIGSHTADFVNHVLDNVSAGVANGGIDDV